MKKEKHHTIKYNFIMNFILTFSRFVFPLITFPYVSRILRASGNGKVAFATSIANYFILVASLGIPTYGIRACSEVRDDKEKLSKVVHEIMFINIVMTLLTVIAFLISINVVDKFSAEKELFYINAIGVVLNSIGMNWLFQALEKYDYITIRAIFFKFLALILMFMFVKKQGDYVAYAAISVLAAAGSNVMNLYYSHNYVDYKYLGNYNFKRHLKPIFILFAQSIATTIYTNLDTVMLGFMKTEDEVGFYNAAVKIKGVVVSLVTSLGGVLLPRMTYYASKKYTEKFGQLIVKSINASLLMSFPLTIYFIIYAKQSILFLAGTDFLKAVLPMQIIMLSIVPIGITNVLGVQCFTAICKEKYVLVTGIIGSLVDFVLNLYLIPEYGVAGAAFSTTVTEVIILICQIYLTKKFEISLMGLHVIRYFMGACFANLICCVIFNMINVTNPFVILAVSGSVMAFIYVMFLLFRREELIMNLFHRPKETK